MRTQQPRLVIAIDPGVEGALAMTYGTQTFLRDLPMTKNTFLESQSKCLDPLEFLGLLYEAAEEFNIQANCKVVYVSEQMQGMGFRTPAKILLGLAEMSASLEMIIRMFCYYQEYDLYIRKYKPKTWVVWMFPGSEKRRGREAEAKRESLEAAREIFPHMAAHLTRQKDHNRAEALLLTFTALCELSRVQVDPAIKMFRKLQEAYHRQIGEVGAGFTDIYGNWPELHKDVKEQIKLRLPQ